MNGQSRSESSTLSPHPASAKICHFHFHVPVATNSRFIEASSAVKYLSFLIKIEIAKLIRGLCLIKCAVQKEYCAKLDIMLQHQF